MCYLDSQLSGVKECLLLSPERSTSMMICALAFCSLFGVFDGHEGSEAAQYAAQAVAPALADAINATWSPGRCVPGAHLCIDVAPAACSAHLEPSQTALPCRASGQVLRNSNALLPCRPLEQQELQSAVVQALHSVDTSFADLAKQHDWEAGSTAVLALLANRSLLTAHIGDSRALICQAPWAVREADISADDFTSETPPKSTDRAPHSSTPGVPPLGLTAAGHAPTEPAAVRKLTEDHSPDRPGEAARIAAAGGSVTPGGPGEAGIEPAGAPFSRSPRACHAVWDELWLGVALLGHHTPEHLVWRLQTIRGLVRHPFMARRNLPLQKAVSRPCHDELSCRLPLRAAGGPARLQGELAVSRALGDLPFRRFGLTAQPELHWHPLGPSDWLLLLVSDGALEKLRPVELCQAALAAEHGAHVWWLVCAASCAYRGSVRRLPQACPSEWAGTRSLSWV